MWSIVCKTVGQKLKVSIFDKHIITWLTQPWVSRQVSPHSADILCCYTLPITVTRMQEFLCDRPKVARSELRPGWSRSPEVQKSRIVLAPKPYSAATKPGVTAWDSLRLLIGWESNKLFYWLRIICSIFWLATGLGVDQSNIHIQRNRTPFNFLSLGIPLAIGGAAFRAFDWLRW